MPALRTRALIFRTGLSNVCLGVVLMIDSTMIEAAPIAEALAQSQGVAKKLNLIMAQALQFVYLKATRKH